ncbi:MAG: fibronectin type III domain-containing protein [Conexibacter sp.]
MSCLGRLSLGARARDAVVIVAGALLALFVAMSSPTHAATITTHPFVSSFDGTGSTAGSFSNLGRVAVHDATGDIFVIDANSSAVDKFDSTGTPQAFSTAELPPGTTSLTGSNTPDLSFSLFGDSDLAVDNSGTASDGNIYVDSEPSGAVYAFDTTGSYLYKLTGFGDACGVAVDPSGNVWVSDYIAQTVTQFTSAGVATGTSVDTSAQGRPCHIAFDSNDNLYVSTYSGPVEKYDSSGAHVAQIDPGSSNAVAVNRSDDHVYVDHGSEIAEYDAAGGSVSTIGAGTLSFSLGVAVDGSTGNASSGHVIAADNGTSLVDIFSAAVVQHLADVTTGVATNVGPTTARIGGIFNADGLSATCTFEYGETSSYGSTAPCSPDPGSGSTPVPVHADISGLTPGTTYHYRLTGTSADGTATGLDQTFTTPQAPAVGGGTATVGSTSATLKATVNPQGAATTYHFEYGTTTAYGASAPVPDASAGSGSSDKNVSVDVDNLQPGTTYHFRVVATNAAGTTEGGDHTFTTRGAVLADTCPNAQLRQQQGSSHLPDCRAWELVSQADKGRSGVVQVSPLATNGDRVMYDILGGAPGTSNGARAKLLATRTASGWVSSSMLPPAPQLLGQNYFFNAASPDLSGYVASAFDGLGTTDGSPDVTIARLDAQGNQTVLHRFPQYFGSGGVDLAASDDLQHVYASVPEAIAPSHQPGTWDLYDFGSGVPQLVGTMPGTGVAPTCGLEHSGSFTRTGFVGGAPTAGEHWTSTDGSRVFFQTRGDDAPACDDPLELYTHDRTTGRSTLISGPPLSGDPDNGVDRFLQATPGGSVAFLRTATSLAAADDVDGNANDMDVYRWTAASGALECLTCAIPQANVLDPTLVSDDGSHVYFSSVEQYDGAPAGATSGTPNTYVWHDGAIHFIAQTDGVNDRAVNGSYPSQATLNGDVLAFVADTADLNARTGSDNGGLRQYYRYDDSDGSITCVSCPADGSAATAQVDPPLTVAFSSVQGNLRAIDAAGSTLVFRTSGSLVPEDRNGAPDLYEWRNGAVGLITSGTATLTSPSLVTLSPDGRDILFVDTASLTADVQDASRKLYDARVDGGFPPPAEAAPPCQGDQCRGPVSGAPALREPTSDASADAAKPPPARFSIAAITAKQRALFARTGRLRLRVHVNRGGVVTATVRAKLGGRSRVVAHARVRARAAGTVTLRLRLSSAARHRLSAGGTLRVSLVVRFSNASIGRRLTLTLVPATANGR